MAKSAKKVRKVRKTCCKFNKKPHQKMTKITEKSAKMIQKWPFLGLFSSKIEVRAVSAKNFLTIYRKK